jgi:CubicO group peptidase (beta-lactamase class C family)
MAMGRRFLREETLAPLYERQGWSKRDAVLQKSLGWSQGFLKEEGGLFSPEPQSFGHPGIGGALGWCDPVQELTIGYVMNRLDWRVRSPRAIALCQALYRSAPVKEPASRSKRAATC